MKLRILTPLLALMALLVAPAAHAGTYPVSFPGTGGAAGTAGVGWLSGGSATGALMPRCYGTCTVNIGGSSYWYGVADNGAASDGVVQFTPRPGTTIAQATLSWKAVRGAANAGVAQFTGAGGSPLTATNGQTFSDMSGGPGNSVFTSGIASGFRAQITDGAGTGSRVGFSAVFTINDPSSPTISAIRGDSVGPNTDWVTGDKENCVVADAADAGSGIVSSSLYLGDSQTPFRSNSYGDGDPLAPGIASGTVGACFNTNIFAEGVTPPITIEVVDASGEGIARNVGTIAIQRTPPSVAGATLPAADERYWRPTFKYAVNAGVSGVATSTLTLDGVKYNMPVRDGFATYAPVANLAEGVHTYSYTLVSNSGLATTTPAASFTLSVPAPTIKNNKPVTGNITSNRPTFSFDVNDYFYDLKTIYLYVDGVSAGPFGGTNDTYTWTAPRVLKDGDHEWKIIANSNSGKSTTLNGSFSVRVPAVSVTVHEAPSGTIASTQPGFSFTVFDTEYGLKAISLTVDGVNAGEPGGTEDLYTWVAPRVLKAGEHKWVLKTTSNSGKIESMVGTFSVAIAAVTPTTPVTVVTGTGGTVVAAPVSQRVISVPRAVGARKGTFATIKVTVKRSGKAQKAVAVTCKMGLKLLARAKTNSFGVAICRFKAVKTGTVTVRATGARAKAVRLTVRR